MRIRFFSGCKPAAHRFFCSKISFLSLFLLGSLPGAAWPQGRIVINEIMYHPASHQVDDEYIELLNAGDAEVNLNDWRLDRGVTYRFPAHILAPGETVCVVANPTSFTARYPEPSNWLGPWQGRLSNDSEEIRLINAVGERIDRVTYYDEGEWVVRERGPLDNNHRGWIWSEKHDGGGRSLELINPALSNRHGANWAASQGEGGTPGAPNSVASEQTAPLILDGEWSPIIPSSSDTVTVTARLMDTDMAVGVAASLYYRVDLPAEATPTAFLMRPMFDDGLHGDGKADDGVYGAQIEPHPDGAIIELYITATNATGLVRSLPAPCDVDGIPVQAANWLYRVDDGFSPDQQPAGDEPPFYRVILTQSERDELVYLGQHYPDSSSNAQMNATFISWDAEGIKVRPTVGIRIRGNGSRRSAPNNYRVNFRSDHRWNNRERLILNVRYPHLQILAGQLFEAAGMPNFNPQAIQLRLNGQNLAAPYSPQGMYARLDVYDADWVADEFPDDSNANVYKCIAGSHNAGLEYLGDNPADYLSIGYDKMTNTSENDWTDLIALTRELNDPSDVDYADRLGQIVNIDQWLRWFALETLLLNNETNLSNGYGDDYALVAGQTDPRFQLLPHDQDTILNQGSSRLSFDTPIFRVANLPHIHRFLTHPQLVGRYYDQLQDLTETVLAPENLQPFLDETIGSWVEADSLQEIMAFVADRNAFAQSQIPSTFDFTVAALKQGEYYYTNQRFVSLYGHAPAIKTQSVLINGLEAEWSPLDGTWELGEALGEPTTLIADGSDWRYLDDGSDQGIAWRAPDFDDSVWPTGTARLGYGDEEVVTTIRYGDDASQKHITYYFRKEFDWDPTETVTTLIAELSRDDGAVVYLNGVEIIRSNLPENVEINYRTTALTTMGGIEETRFHSYSVDPALLLPGRNVIAAEAHQRSQTSSDLGFDFRMVCQTINFVTTSGISLSPGLQRLVIQTFDGPGGSGNLLQETSADVWYDTAPETDFSGTLTTDTVLGPEGNPWKISGDIIVPEGVTLAIAPGASLFFDAGVGIQVYGRLVAEGTEYARIRLAADPQTRLPWNGIRFSNSKEDNRLAFVDMDYGDGGAESILVSWSRLLVDHMTWTDSDQTIIEVYYPTLRIANSVFPNIENAETIHGLYIDPEGYFIIENNIFGTTTGYSDVIDFTYCKRPGPILEVYDNIFLGGSDDGLDLDGTDAHVEGNLFINFQKGHSGDSTCNAVATGHAGDWVSDVVLARNIFINNDHHILIKDDCFVLAENNTFIDADIAAINFHEPARPTTPGRGATLKGNIFWKQPMLFENQFPISGTAPTISLIQNIAPAAFHYLGDGNLDADPLITNASTSDVTLLSDSPAIGAGPNGLDMGALVPAGPSITGEPVGWTTRRDALLTIYGPGMVAYRYRLDDGPESEARPTSVPIQLTNLTTGEHVVTVRGQNSAGRWQELAEATLSQTWRVVETATALAVTELMVAPPAGSEYEFIEIKNTLANETLDLSGFVFTNGIDFTFPSGALIAPGQYALITNRATPEEINDFRAWYDLNDGVLLFGPYTGKLANDGERVTLQTSLMGGIAATFAYETGRGWPLAADGYGHSLVPLAEETQRDNSLSYGRAWRASRFMNGSPGRGEPEIQGDLLLNEIVAHTDVTAPPYDSNDWIELVNMTSNQLTLGGPWYLSDDGFNLTQWTLPDGVLMPGQRIAYDEMTGFHNPITTGFGINKAGENIFLAYMPDGPVISPRNRIVDCVRLQGQENERSWARHGDGNPFWTTTAPTRDRANTVKIDDVVMDEIMYHPPLDDAHPLDESPDEYLELWNPTNTAIALWNEAGAWRLDGGIDFTFGANVAIPPNGRLLIVGFDPTDTVAMDHFRNQYGAQIDANVIQGPYVGSLSNQGERITLSRPQAPDAVDETASWVVVDELIYFDDHPFPAEADGQGKVLQRVSPRRVGNEPANWFATAPSPGRAGPHKPGNWSGWILH